MQNKSNNDIQGVSPLAEANATGACHKDDSKVTGQHPDPLCVTFVDCLHPESAEASIDERFLVPGNPWWTVYEGAKGGMPMTTSRAALTGPEGEGGTENAKPAATEPPEDGFNKASGVQLTVGCMISFIAVLAVFVMEAAAFCIYWISAGFYQVGQSMDPPSAATGLIYSICLLAYYSMALVDSALLIISVLVAEILALALFLACCVFNGRDMALGWHQYLRKTCHLLRWAFRSKCLSPDPPRHLCCASNKEEEGQQCSHDEAQEWGQHIAPSAPKENRIETARASVTPSAPPDPCEERVIVLDESNIIVDHDGEKDDSSKDDMAWLRDV